MPCCSEPSTSLKHGADPNLREETGGAALHCAANAAMVEILLAAGADPRLLTKDGDTALHRCQDPEAAERLIQAGADLLVRNHAGHLAFEVHAARLAKEREWLPSEFALPEAERLVDLLRRETEVAELRAASAAVETDDPFRAAASIHRL